MKPIGPYYFTGDGITNHLYGNWTTPEGYHVIIHVYQGWEKWHSGWYKHLHIFQVDLKNVDCTYSKAVWAEVPENVYSRWIDFDSGNPKCIISGKPRIPCYVTNQQLPLMCFRICASGGALALNLVEQREDGATGIPPIAGCEIDGDGIRNMTEFARMFKDYEWNDEDGFITGLQFLTGDNWLETALWYNDDPNLYNIPICSHNPPTEWDYTSIDSDKDGSTDKIYYNKPYVDFSDIEWITDDELDWKDMVILMESWLMVVFPFGEINFKDFNIIAENCENCW